MAGRRIRQVPQVIATYKSVASQLKGIKRWREKPSVAYWKASPMENPSMAMIHIYNKQVLITAHTFLDWLKIVGEATFSVVKHENFPVCVGLYGVSDNISAHFYPQNPNHTGDKIWEVYL